MKIALWASKLQQWVIQQGTESYTEYDLREAAAWWRSRGFCTCLIKRGA